MTTTATLISNLQDELDNVSRLLEASERHCFDIVSRNEDLRQQLDSQGGMLELHRMRVKELEDGMADYYTMIQNQDKAAIDELRSEIAELEAKLTTRDQQVAEACASYVEDQCLPDSYSEPCLVIFADEIRSGEWKRYRKGGE